VFDRECTRDAEVGAMGFEDVTDSAVDEGKSDTIQRSFIYSGVVWRLDR